MLGTSAKKVEAYADELRARWRHVPELRLRAMIRDLQALLRSASPQDAYGIQNLLGLAQMRLGKNGEALRHFEIAARMGFNPDGLQNLGVTYFAEGRFLDALDAWVKASEMPDGYSVITLGNLAEVFAVLGREDDAWYALSEAIRIANPDDLSHLHHLAAQSAELGADDLAVEFFARLLSRLQGKGLGDLAARDFLRAQRSTLEALTVPPMLDAAIQRAIELGPTIDSVPRTRYGRSTETLGEDAMASALEVFEKTRASRARATAAVLAQHEGVAEDG